MTKTTAPPRILKKLGETKPYVVFDDLYGPEGNAFVILGRCKSVLTAHRIAPKVIEAWQKHATRGTYSEVLTAVLDYFSMPVRTERQMKKLLKQHGSTRT